VRYVGVGRRFVALLVDAVVFAVAAAPFVEVTRTPGFVRYELLGMRAVWPFVLWLLYLTAMEGAVGATLGKLALGIRVLRDDGSTAGWGAAVVRNVARVVDAFPYVIPYLLGAAIVWGGGGTRQRLGDRWAATVVVRWPLTQPTPAGGQTAATHAGWVPPAPAPPLPPPPP
jgi:uncharacterized RDD family membrane protein YckC